MRSLDRAHSPEVSFRGATRSLAYRRHRFVVEAVVLVALYEVYSLARGLVRSGRSGAVAHGHDLFTVERWLHIDIERTVQRAAGSIPGLLSLFDVEYATLHLIGVVGVFIWLYRTSAIDFLRYRFALITSCLCAIIVFTVLPMAPPRMLGIGIADSLAKSGVNPDSRTLTLFYNPYAAFPSLHEAFAVLVGFYLWRHAKSNFMRLIGLLYPLWIAIEVLATGNHFVIDVIAGGLVAGACIWAACRLYPVAAR